MKRCFKGTFHPKHKTSTFILWFFHLHCSGVRCEVSSGDVSCRDLCLFFSIMKDCSYVVVLKEPIRYIFKKILFLLIHAQKEAPHG